MISSNLNILYFVFFVFCIFFAQRDAGPGIYSVEHLAQAGTVPVLSGNYGKVPGNAETDLILQSSTGYGRAIVDGGEEEGERRNIQPRRVSGFAIFNFAPDPAAGAAAFATAETTVGPETTVQDPVSHRNKTKTTTTIIMTTTTKTKTKIILIKSNNDE